MNPTLLISAVVAVLSLQSAEAIFGADIVAATGSLFFPATGTIGGTHLILASGTAGTVGAVAAVGGGVLLLKAAALLYLNSRRSKRSTLGDDIDIAFVTIAAAEPQACMRRLICEVAAGSEDNLLLSLFNNETPATSPKFDFAVAAALGKQLKNVQACELRYSCPIDSQQLQKLF